MHPYQIAPDYGESALALPPQDPVCITSITELFTALAQGWTEAGPNPQLVANVSGVQVVQYPCPWLNGQADAPRKRDIPVQSGAYLLSGFCKFEAHSMFPGMFYTSSSGEWQHASLTHVGYDFAMLCVNDVGNIHPDIALQPFFNPKLKAVDSTLALGREGSHLRIGFAQGGLGR